MARDGRRWLGGGWHGLACASCAAMIGCAPEPRCPDPVVVYVPAPSATPAPTTTPAPAVVAAPPDPAARCKRLLDRFGPVATREELASCLDALSPNVRGPCYSVPGLDAYDSCFASCMASVSLTEKDYDPADVSSSPVANCEGGCRQTTPCDAAH